MADGKSSSRISRRAKRSGIGISMAQDDFKYTMQDLYKVYFGVNCTYREILENEDAYYKFKAVCRQYLIRETDPDTSIGTHLMQMKDDSPEADVYRQIGARIKLNKPAVRKTLFGREEKIFKEEIWKVGDLLKMTPGEKESSGIVLSELQIPKLKLREFAI